MKKLLKKLHLPENLDNASAGELLAARDHMIQIRKEYQSLVASSLWRLKLYDEYTEAIRAVTRSINARLCPHSAYFLSCV